MAEAANLIAFLNDADSRRVVQDAESSARVHRGTVRSAARVCRNERSPDVLLVDLDGEQNPISHMADLLEVCRPQSAILATGSENNVALANDLYRGGVFLYLPKPLDATNVRSAMREVAAVNEEVQPKIRTSHVLQMHGKGMGVNTLTAALAHMAADQGRYVGCLDLDPNFGVLALALNTQPERGLAQALRDPASSADILTLERLQARVSNRIRLVAHPMDQISQGQSDEQGLDGFIKALSTQVHMIVVCGASPQQAAAIRHLITNHMIVFEPTPAGVSIAARHLRLLEGTSSTLVLNHARPLPNMLTDEHLRRAFGDRLPDLRIPYLRNMAQSMVLGEPQRAITRRERDALTRYLHVLMGASVEREGEA